MPSPETGPSNSGGRVYNVPAVAQPNRDFTDLELKYLVFFLGLAFLPSQLLLRKEQPTVELLVHEIFAGHEPEEAVKALEFLSEHHFLIFEAATKAVLVSPHLLRGILTAHSQAEGQN